MPLHRAAGPEHGQTPWRREHEEARQLGTELLIRRRCPSQEVRSDRAKAGRGTGWKDSRPLVRKASGSILREGVACMRFPRARIIEKCAIFRENDWKLVARTFLASCE